MQTVWITGASSGIGEALAKAWSRRGARLVLSARRADALERVRKACANPDEHEVIPLDLTDPESIEDAVLKVQAEGLHLDVLVNNGGISQRSRVVDTDLDVDRRIMEVNYFGTVALTKAVLPAMLSQGGGRIVVVTSLVGKFGTPKRSAYAASKHALHGFFDSLRAEVSHRGVGITIVCPGFIRTDISVNALMGDGSQQGTMDDAQAGGMPADVFAERMIKAVEDGKDEVYIGGREVLGVYLKRLSPRLFNTVIRKAKVT